MFSSKVLQDILCNLIIQLVCVSSVAVNQLARIHFSAHRLWRLRDVQVEVRSYLVAGGEQLDWRNRIWVGLGLGFELGRGKFNCDWAVLSYW